MRGYSLALFSHLLVVILLLGTDPGRLYLTRRGAVATTPPAARNLAAWGVLWSGRISGVALILIIPLGFWLGSLLGAYRIDSPAWRVVPWLLPGALLALMLAADRVANQPDGTRFFAHTESVVRMVFGVGQIWDGFSVIFLDMTHMVEAHWLAAKLSIYGLLLLLSIPVRQTEIQLRRELAANQAVGAGLEKHLQRLGLPVATSWFLVLLAAWLGTAKPA